MRDTQHPTGWSNRFRYYAALYAVVGVSPMLLFLRRASDVPPIVLGTACAFGLGVVGAGVWYVLTHRTVSLKEIMSERERWILGVEIAFVLALIAFNVFKQLAR